MTGEQKRTLRGGSSTYKGPGIAGSRGFPGMEEAGVAGVQRGAWWMMGLERWSGARSRQALQTSLGILVFLF